LNAGNLEPLSTPWILALHEVIAPQHVGSRLGKPETILVIHRAPKRLFLFSHQPADFVHFGLMAVETGKGHGFPRFTLLKEISFFHKLFILSSNSRELQGVHRAND